jgi:type VI secretion system secreted protein VgrG
MPPYELPANKTMSAVKSNSSKGGQGFNEIRFEDKKGEEQIFIHAERNEDIRVKNDQFETIEHSRHLVVGGDELEHIGNKRHEIVEMDHEEEIGRDRHLRVKGNQGVIVHGDSSFEVHGGADEYYMGAHSEFTVGILYLCGVHLVIEGLASVTLKSGGSFISVNPSGVYSTPPIQAGGAPLAGQLGAVGGWPPPTEAREADTGRPGEVDEFKKESPAKPYKPDEDKTHWIEIELVDEDGKGVPGELYRITLPDGSVAEGTLDKNGRAKLTGIDGGTSLITFPNLDTEAWEALG